MNHEISIRKFVLSDAGPFNTVRVGAKDQIVRHCIGLIELDCAGPPVISRLELTIRNFHTQDNLPSVSGFIRLRQNTAAVEIGGQSLSGSLPCLIGVCISDKDQQYVTAPVDLRLDALTAGATLSGALTGTIPKSFAAFGGKTIAINVLGEAAAFGRFRAKFQTESTICAAGLRVSDDTWSCNIPAPDDVDLLIPSHSTITIDWCSRDEQSGKLNRKRDIIADVILGSRQATDLEFHLADPLSQRLLAPAILAEERGAGVKVKYSMRQETSGERRVEIQSSISGQPGRYVLLDMIIASADPRRANPAIEGRAFVGSAAPGAIPICCNMKPPGPNSPGSDPVLTNPPGGGGGAPPEPGGGNGGSGTPDPNSSTSDGGNTCDANYSVVIPPNGLLDLTSVVRPLREDEAEIALVGVFRNQHKLPTGDATLLFSDGSDATRRENPVWISTRGRHRLSVETPRGRTLREVDIVELPIDTSLRQVFPVFIRLPETAGCDAPKPFVLADVGNGLAFEIRSVEMAHGRIAIHLYNESGGWIAVPIETKLKADEADLATSTIGGRKFHTLFVKPGVSTVEASR